MDKCPFCEAENLKPDADFDKPHYACETWEGHNGRMHRGNACYETQLSTQAERIKVLERIVKKMAPLLRYAGATLTVVSALYHRPPDKNIVQMEEILNHPEVRALEGE
jgi:hypothetical protein